MVVEQLSNSLSDLTLDDDEDLENSQWRTLIQKWTEDDHWFSFSSNDMSHLKGRNLFDGLRQINLE